jgi:hypothetical protein
MQVCEIHDGMDTDVNSIIQSVEGDLGFRPERGITRVPEATLYQGSENCSNRGLPSAHWDFDRIIPGKLRSS